MAGNLVDVALESDGLWKVTVPQVPLNELSSGSQKWQKEYMQRIATNGPIKDFCSSSQTSSLDSPLEELKQGGKNSEHA